ncbi:CG13601 [Drosophila busckii]|uniref:CG13601 n=1 Tax=Drosophila busckii TaxID=30019 RepID=A0A0M4F451_DROBS|nr:putative OPA3-like protein CG13603 [Drosophila busckii]XP_017849473.1 putative OPA3-like protein CG13603 [Drosophila busckii]ALC46107.1 CG13601 [Drosophila busckii]
MVIGVFPAAKLGVLAIKQISKPIANVLKSNAKSSPLFRKYVCMPPAQFYNWVEVKTKMWALNLGRPVTVPPLNEAMAIELGANLLGEFIIFAIGAGLLIFEYSRQSIKENKKTEAMEMEKMQLTTTLTEMNFRLERQDAQIREMTRVLADLDSRNIFRWHKEPIQEYVPFDPSTPDQSASARNPKGYEGFYDPQGGMAFRALHFLQTQIFIDGRDRQAKAALQQIDVLAGNLEESLGQAVTQAEAVVLPAK